MIYANHKNSYMYFSLHKSLSFLCRRSAMPNEKAVIKVSFWPCRIIIAGKDEVEETNLAFGSFINCSTAYRLTIPNV